MTLSKLLLHKKTGGNTKSGWQGITPLTTEIISEIQEDVSSTNRASTSVPSPLARIFSFNTALKSMCVWKEFLKNNPSESQPAKYQQYGRFHTSSNDAKLVSELLDVLEWIYHKGKSGFDFQQKFEITEFGGLNNDDKLYHTLGETNGMKCLSSALKYACDHKAFGGNLNIQFLLHGENGLQKKLVGGTSPFTVIYTAPNFKEYGESLEISVNKKDKKTRKLFDSTCPLEERSTDFQAYVKWLVKEIYVQQNGDENPPSAGNEPPIFYFKKYVDLAVTANANSGENARDVPICDGYTLRTTNNAENGDAIYTQMAIDNFDGKKVLLLSNDSENDDLVFFNGNEWSGFKDKLPNPNNLTIDKTCYTIPERNINEIFGVTFEGNYTFVTVDDLFQDSLIRLSDGLNTTEFRTIAVDGENNYLLPVTPLFIRLFGIEGLDIILFNKFELSFNYRIDDKLSIQIKKDYNDKIIRSAQIFDLSIFPSKKFTDHNLERFVQLFSENNDTNNFQLNFYKIGTEVKCTSNPVARGSYSDLQTKYWKISGDFDFITAKFEINYGLIFPKWDNCLNTQFNENLTYGVDFGTSNTHVSFFKGIVGTPDTINDLILNNNVLRLFDETNRNNISDVEFIPKQQINFPFETIIQCIDEDKHDLFLSKNIAFEREQKLLDGFKFISEIKWNTSLDERYKADIKVFFEEILLIIKLHCLENNGKLSAVNFRFTFPLIKTSTYIKDVFEDIVKPLVTIHFNENTLSFKYLSESEAPTFYYRKIENHFNIDIGGGSTDIFIKYIDNGTKKIGSSIKFAGNDLFSNKFYLENTKPGFIDVYEKWLKPKTDKTEKINRTIKPFFEGISKGRNSYHDITSIFFNLEEDLNIEKAIYKPNSPFIIVYVYHLTAILYYCAYLWGKKQIPMNKEFTLTYTGNGSKYLNFLKSQSNFKFNSFLNFIFNFSSYFFKHPEIDIFPNNFSDERKKDNIDFKLTINNADNVIDVKKVTVNGLLQASNLNSIEGQNDKNNEEPKEEIDSSNNNLEDSTNFEFLNTESVNDVNGFLEAIELDLKGFHLVFERIFDTIIAPYFKEINFTKDEVKNVLDEYKTSYSFKDCNKIEDYLNKPKPYFLEVVKGKLFLLAQKVGEKIN